MHHRLAPICAALVATACFSHAATAVTIYNPASGSGPAAPAWLTSTTGGTVTPAVVAGTYRLNTTADAAISSGSLYLGQALDTNAGFSLTFNLQVLAESHLTADRAGYSVIAVGADTHQSIEISFWGDRVWAGAYDGTSFTHGVEAVFDTSTAAHDYSLLVQNQHYTLSSGTTTLLSGSLVNYSPLGSVYAIGSSVFFGDDTSRAASSTALGLVTLTPVPEPTTAGLFLLGGAVLAIRTRRTRA